MSDVQPSTTPPPAPCRLATGCLVALGTAGILAFAVNIAMGGMSFLAIVLPPVVLVTLVVAIRRLQRTVRPRPVLVLSGLAGLALTPCLLALPFLLLLVPQYVHFIARGPKVVQSAASPDGEFRAYVVDEPAIDGPAHVLYVERKDGIRFIPIDKLPEDVDSIEKIVWSPQGDVVVFQTRFALIAANVPGFQTIKIPLGIEWSRSNPGKHWTFCTGGPRRTIAAIEFPEPGILRYRLDNSSRSKTVHMRGL